MVWFLKQVKTVKSRTSLLPRSLAQRPPAAPAATPTTSPAPVGGLHIAAIAVAPSGGYGQQTWHVIRNDSTHRTVAGAAAGRATPRWPSGWCVSASFLPGAAWFRSRLRWSGVGRAWSPPDRRRCLSMHRLAGSRSRRSQPEWRLTGSRWIGAFSRGQPYGLSSESQSRKRSFKF